MQKPTEVRVKVIDRVYYIFSYEGDLISFAVDPVLSDKKVLPDSTDPFDWDPAPRRVYMDVPTENVFAVMRELVDFIEMVIKKHRPYYFYYCSLSSKRDRLYARYAEKLATRHDYLCEVVAPYGENTYRFYRC